MIFGAFDWFKAMLRSLFDSSVSKVGSQIFKAGVIGIVYSFLGRMLKRLQDNVVNVVSAALTAA